MKWFLFSGFALMLVTINTIGFRTELTVVPNTIVQCIICTGNVFKNIVVIYMTLQGIQQIIFEETKMNSCIITGMLDFVVDFFKFCFKELFSSIIILQ